MGKAITVDIETKGATAALKRVIDRLTKTDDILHPIGEMLVESTKRRFETSTAPDGTLWEKTERGNKPLVDTGTLAETIFKYVSNGTLYVGTDRFSNEWEGGAAVHQFGTKPHKIVPKNKKALSFGDRILKSVNHPGIKARPFLGISDDDERAIHDIIHRFLLRAAKG